MTGTRPPLLARLAASLIVGEDAEVVRGDLEETYRRRLRAEGDSRRLRADWTIDAAASAAQWWWRALRRSSIPRAARTRGEKMRTIGPELRQMLRGLRRRPGYAGMVALTLGLGIGATTTIYSVVDAMLVRALPYRDAGQLVVIGNTIPGQEWLEGRDGVQRIEEIALPNLRDLQLRLRGVSGTSAIERRIWLSAPPGNPPELLDVANVTEGFFGLLSVKPLIGRLPREGDQAPTGGKWGTAISYESWQRRFGGDPNVIGKTFWLFTVVGVLPPDFVQPAALVGSDVEFWTHLDPNDRRYTDRRRRAVKVLARLDGSVPLAAVRRDLQAAQRRLAIEEPIGNALPDGKTLGAGINSLRDATVGAEQRPVLLFLGAALLLLVLAGTNAANLLIVRGLERDAELSLRRALGASRGRLVAALIAESVFLALAGGGLGFGIAIAGVGAFRRFGPQSLPRMSEVSVNLRIVLAGALLSLAVGVLVGLAPAVRSSGANLLANLRSSLTAFAPGGTRLRTGLAATQLALALVLGIGASLLFRSFVHLRTEQLGFQPNGLTAFTVAFKTPRPWETWDQVIAAVKTVPGVTAVAGASSLPFQTAGLSLRIASVERPGDDAIAPVATYAVSPTYFETARIPLRQGRPFGESDQPASRRVAIVNERFARETFGGRTPLGRMLTVRDEGARPEAIEIVGVVGNVVQARVEDGVQPAVYMPYTQMPMPMSVLVATRRPQDQVLREIRQALSDGGLSAAPLIGASSMAQRIEASRAAPRFQLLLLASFAGAAMLLAAIGCYGTLAFTVRSRMRELGIRMAMGASQRQIFELVLRQGMTVLGIGLAVGVVGAIGVTRLLRGFLYRVSPLDPTAFLGAMLLLVVAVLVAALRPAGRAAQLDPMATMRSHGF
jgi:predicted permease